MNDKIAITGQMTATVYGHTPKGLRAMGRARVLRDLHLTPKERFDARVREILDNPAMSFVKQVSVEHNIVTDEGDAMIADLMAESPALAKVNNANGKIPVGTAYSGTGMKARTWVVSQSGTAKALTATYPKLKGSFGAANDNVVQYRCNYVAGDLNATINEAGLANASSDVGGQLLAYAQVNPSATVGSSDTLQIDWEITFVGA